VEPADVVDSLSAPITAQLQSPNYIPDMCACACVRACMRACVHGACDLSDRDRSGGGLDLGKINIRVLGGGVIAPYRNALNFRRLCVHPHGNLQKKKIMGGGLEIFGLVNFLNFGSESK
jgi:hypothetical protein